MRTGCDRRLSILVSLDSTPVRQHQTRTAQTHQQPELPEEILRAAADLDRLRLQHSDFDLRALAWLRFYREFTLYQTHTFTNDSRRPARQIQFRLRHPPAEGKSYSVVFDAAAPLLSFLHPLHHHSFGAAVFAHVDQRLLRNARQLAAYGLRKRDFIRVHNKLRADSRLSLESLHRVAQKRRQFPRIYLR